MPLDYKFSEYTGKVYDTYKYQLAMYSMMIEENYNVESRKGYIVFTRSNNKLKEIEYNDIFGNMFFDIKKELEIKNEDIVYSKDEMFDYKFVSPYLPLNQKNFQKFLDGEYDLNKAITNNILEVLKGLGIWLKPDEKIYVSQDLKINKRELKDVSMISFDGKFSTNIKFPDYFSIGKRKSIGYGTFVIDKAK